MDDAAIIDLYWQRDERAIERTRAKYGAYCRTIARNIVGSPADAEECESDTYLRAWNAMPPTRPTVLKAFLGKICRNVSLKRWRAANTAKRGGGEVALSLDELGECVPAHAYDPAEALEAAELARVIDAFLAGLGDEERRMFVRRYFYVDSVAQIAERFACGQSKVKMSLKRTRDKLAVHLAEQGVHV